MLEQGPGAGGALPRSPCVRGVRGSMLCPWGESWGGCKGGSGGGIFKGKLLQEASGQRGWAHHSPGLCSAIELPAVLFHCKAG